MKITREQLFAAPKLARRAEDRLERGKAAVSAARARATEIAQQCVAQPRLRPNGLQRRRLERLNGMGIGPVVKPAHGAPLSQSRAPYRAEQPEHPRQGREINL